MRFRIRGTPNNAGVRQTLRERETRASFGLPMQAGEVLVSATNTIGNLTLQTRSTTGYGLATFWDASTVIGGSGSSNLTFSLSKSLVGSPAGKKPVNVSSSNALGGKGGALTFINIPVNATEVDLRGMANNSTPLNLTINSANTDVIFPDDPFVAGHLQFNGVWKRLDAVKFSSLAVQDSNATEMDLSWNSNVASIYIATNNALHTVNLHGIDYQSPDGTLYVLNNPLVTTVLCDNTNPRFIFITGNTSLTQIDLTNCEYASAISLSGNNLTNVNVVGCRPTNGKYGKTITPALDLRLNQLNADALDKIFADLTPVGSPIGTPIIHVASNPGAATCTPSIATTKGYVVLTV